MARLLNQVNSRYAAMGVLGVAWLGAVHLVSDEYLFSFRQSTGASMLPTLAMEGDWLLTVRWPVYALLDSIQECGAWTEDARLKVAQRKMRYSRTYGRPIALGDLVSAASPKDHYSVCKRVLGLPGDVVLLDPRMMPLPRSAWNFDPSSITDNAADDDEEPTRQPDGVIGSIRSKAEYVTVPKGHVFLCGDNLSASIDSRDYGPVPLALVSGRIVGRAKGIVLNELIRTARKRLSKILPIDDS